MKFLTIILLFCTFHVHGVTQGQISTLHHSLDQYSVSQQLAFYSLYPNCPEGHAALQRAWQLLNGRNDVSFPSPPASKAICALVNKHSKEPIKLSADELNAIDKLASRLSNRKLRGHNAKSEAEVMALQPDEIDLARALFLAQLVDSAENELLKLSSYEAMVDLMALQILAKIPLNATPEMKIRAINTFVFEEMGFRFPPHSAYAKNIDEYTFLSSVLDSRRGVCLGVSILYICIAQRLGLPLEMITPPGHIYVRYKPPKGEEINIETTARGVHVDSEEYLSVNTRSLQQRNIKEVIGLAYFNQASALWSQNENKKALEAYLKAFKYMPDDKFLQELMGYQYLLNGMETEGRSWLEKVRDYIPEHEVAKKTLAEDYLEGNVDTAGINAVFMHVDETRESILKKKKALEDVLKKYPKFRAGVFHLAVVWLQIHREGEALEVLKQYHNLDPNDPTAEYYLTALCAMRMDCNSAWQHMEHLEKLLQARNHHPKMLKDLKRELTAVAPR